VVYPPELLDHLEAVEPAPWEGRAFRLMFADYAPDVENTRGARWNLADVAAVYTSLRREGAIAEAEHKLSIQPIRPRVKQTIYTLDISLASVLDLTDVDLLAALGVGEDELGGDDLRPCQDIGGATHWLDHDGLFVPSARSSAVNLVIFAANRRPDTRFEVTAAEVVSAERP
jgi:RES domain-containing protein